MRSVVMCRVHALASSWFESFQILGSNTGNSSHFRVLASRNYGLEGGHGKKWIRRPINTKAEGRNKNALTSKTNNLRQGLTDGLIAAGTELNINKSEISEVQRIQYCDIQQKIGDSRDLSGPVTVIVFDIETTGFSREYERIVEIALQDLGGGENSTFQTLVNPERIVPNPHVHGIYTHMVNKPEVPRMKELIPILLQYIKSRQKPGGYVLLLAHNARNFDVPFLAREFSRYDFEIPSDWLFVDTLPLGRELMKLLTKSGGPKLLSRVSVPALTEYYGIKLDGPAHRAMTDVKALSLILKGLTFDLKLSVSGLVERSFTASDLSIVKRKNNST